jgi:hypothetical protein
VDHLKQFGSHAFVRIPKSKDTQELIFVGYSDTLKCSRFLDKSCDSIVISHGGFLEGVYEIELDTKTEYEGF